MTRRMRIWVALAGFATCLDPAHAGGLAIVATELRDNGDRDGYGDTNETVELWLTVRNTTTTDLTGVTAQLAIAEGRTTCILDGTATIGDVAAGAQVRSTEPLVFHIALDQDRAALGLSPFDALTATFDLTLTGSPIAPTAYPSQLVFNLDLDVTGGGAPTTVTEDFETGGLGLFQVQNLDFGRHDDLNVESGLANGYRCQYHESYCSHASCQGEPGFDSCSPGGTSAAADAVWWRVDGPSVPGGGRGYSETHSLYFGEPLGPALGYTTPLGVLEAVTTTAPVHLAAGRWCSNAGTTSCSSDAGCPSGGRCVEVVPTLTFKQQASFVDSRSIVNIPPDHPGKALDRGVVSIQLADSSGEPAGPWMRLEPSINVHDQIPAAAFLNCTFDPMDDGSSGDDLFPSFTSADGRERRGPSSTCADERVFTWMGATAGAFDPLAVGNADGPGLQGATGPGTWVESSYDLSPYRGRSIRLRFLASTTRYDTFATWQAAVSWNPWPGDDGWWIDDVTIAGATTSSGTVTIDTHDNSGLTPDGDSDGVDDLCDNCPAVSNGSQSDADDDGTGDVCDLCTDGDADGLGSPGFPANTCASDNCPLVPNASQTDGDLDAVGDACDVCPAMPDPSQVDSDTDGAGNVCDCAPFYAWTYPGAPEVNDGLDNQCPGDTDFGINDELSGAIGFFDAGNRNLLSWPSQIGAFSYTVTWAIGAAYPPFFCLTATTFSAQYLTTSAPPPGFTTFYLVRSRTNYVGSLGRASSGVERRIVSCLAP